uniref:Uncharacterized protein n=1 Tax=Arundo donax TaxID=35708 RepID=A0A0A9AG80_ARUDO
MIALAICGWSLWRRRTTQQTPSS